ncbi:toxin Cry1Ac domain D-VI-related protein [Brevibacillus agri]|uniref:toxin Cry1Ac domain D-VI-related protein n=1 Tax=Brevibacillus agri TaxID=51101 RepID=UPI000472D4CB|nr:toxin Cry1Ac domain D-VI-related protein [Brevibacillus agri]
MNKKVTLSLLSATVFASMAASAFAAPTQGVYMGGSVDKFYKLDDLFNLSAAAKKQFVVDMNAANPDLDFKNLVFVDFDGKGAKFSEILAAGTLPKAKRDLTKADFEGSYVTVNLDGSNGASYDPRNDAVDVPTGDLKVESVSAINAKTLVVDFNKELTEEEKAAVTYEVKKGGAVQLFKLDSYDADKAKLVRTSGAALEAGTYEITVKGLKDGVTNSGTVTVEAQKATTLEVTGEALTDATAKAKVAVELKDQYGEKLALSGTDFTVTAFNKTQNATVKVEFDPTDKYFYIDTKTSADAFKMNDEVNVVIMHNKSGLKATKTLKVSAAANVSTITFGNIELPTGKSLLTEDLTNVKVPYTAKDQYGNDIPLSKGDNGNVEVISSDATVIAAADVDFISENNVKKVQVAKFLKAGKATITLFNKVTGDTSSITFDVQEKAGSIYDVELEKPAIDLPETGSAVAVGLNVTDKYGTKIEPKNYVNNVEEAFTVNSSNTSVVVPTINTDAKDKNYGKLMLEPKGKKGQTATITVTVNGTGETASLSVTIGEKAVLSIMDVSADSKHKTSLVKGAKTTVVFAVKDQYGNVTEKDNDEYTIEYKVKDSSTNITLSGAKVGESAPSVDVTAAKVGSATLVATLKKGEEVVATKEVAFTVVANDSTNLTYEVADVPKLYKGGAADNVYAEKLSISAKDASGTVFAIPTEEIINVTSSDKAVADVAKTANGWVVFGKKVKEEGKDSTVTLTIVLNSDNEVKTITKDVVVSSEDLAAATVRFMDKDPDGKTDEAVTVTELPKDAKDVTAFPAENPSDLDEVDLFVVVQDQFGRYVEAISADEVLKDGPDYHVITFTSKNSVGIEDVNSDDDITIAKGEVDFKTLADNLIIEEGASFRLVGTTANGKVDYVTVQLTGKKASDDTLALTDATKAVKALFVDYSKQDALAKDVDQAKIDAAKAKVTALKDSADKATLLNDIQAAQDLLDTADVTAEVAKYETAATIAKAVKVGDDVTATVVALKKDAIANDDVKVEVTAVAGQNAAGEDLLNLKDGKVTLAKQAAKGETDKEATVTITLTKGNATEEVTVTVTLEEQDV